MIFLLDYSCNAQDGHMHLARVGTAVVGTPTSTYGLPQSYVQGFIVLCSWKFRGSTARCAHKNHLYLQYVVQVTTLCVEL